MKIKKLQEEGIVQLEEVYNLWIPFLTFEKITMHLLLYIYYLQETIILQVTLFTYVDIMMINKLACFLRYAPVLRIPNQINP